MEENRRILCAKIDQVQGPIQIMALANFLKMEIEVVCVNKDSGANHVYGKGPRTLKLICVPLNLDSADGQIRFNHFVPAVGRTREEDEEILEICGAKDLGIWNITDTTEKEMDVLKDVENKKVPSWRSSFYSPSPGRIMRLSRLAGLAYPTDDVSVPYVRPNAMHTVPSLWNSEVHLCQASSDDIQLCAEKADFRLIIPCDEDIYSTCISIMKDKNWVPASDSQEATDILSA